jgi:hypothetical protein
LAPVVLEPELEPVVAELAQEQQQERELERVRELVRVLVRPLSVCEIQPAATRDFYNRCNHRDRVSFCSNSSSSGRTYDGSSNSSSTSREV